ncbi:hypothetical protein GF340_01795 [Candidatus Peregrinibacteria bacterium]|nr:hypothetical protein [Candidatus Peregrinibacteria bacterium]
MDTLLLIVSLVLLSLLLVGTFIFVQFRGYRNDLNLEWFSLLEKLNIRLDKIPSLIEIMKKKGVVNNKLFKEVIESRRLSWSILDDIPKKVHADLKISNLLHQLWEYCGQSESIQKSVGFLSIQSQFKKINREIEALTDDYNSNVRKYNKKIDLPVLSAYLRLFGFKHRSIFEFEA